MTSNVWPVIQGLVTQAEMDALVRAHHRNRCSTFDGGARNQGIGAGPLTKDHRIYHEATIALVESKTVTAEPEEER